MISLFDFGLCLFKVQITDLTTDPSKFTMKSLLIHSYAAQDGISTCTSLQWRHNEHDGVSNHQPHDCLLNRLSRRGSKKTSKLRVTGLCAKKISFDDVIMMYFNILVLGKCLWNSGKKGWWKAWICLFTLDSTEIIQLFGTSLPHWCYFPDLFYTDSE